MEPSEYWISRCVKHLRGRTLQIDDVWNVKTLMNQQNMAPRRQKGLENLQVSEAEIEALVEAPKTLRQYLANLFTYCVAWARAGCDRLSGTPRELTRTADTTLIIIAPLDVMMSYHDRAQRTAHRMLRGCGEALTLAWVVARDKEERVCWMDLVWHSGLPFGQIVQKVMRQREASWVPPSVLPPFGIASTLAIHHNSKGGGQAEGVRTQELPPAGAGEQGSGGSQTVKQEMGDAVATQRMGSCETMANGKMLCAEFNKGKCLAVSHLCKGGLHLCNQRCRNGRACGFSNHRATNCKNPKTF